MAAHRLRITVNYVEILDRKDLDEHGEFVFEFTGTIADRDVVQTKKIPETGYISISDHPSMNKVTLNKVIFEGEVNDGEGFVLEATGTELDRFSANDHLNPYRRDFSGDVSGWAGKYGPWDEGSKHDSDPEQLGDWRLAYTVDIE
jgi:hypothetical protein